MLNCFKELRIIIFCKGGVVVPRPEGGGQRRTEVSKQSRYIETIMSQVRDGVAGEGDDVKATIREGGRRLVRGKDLVDFDSAGCKTRWLGGTGGAQWRCGETKRRFTFRGGGVQKC